MSNGLVKRLARNTVGLDWIVGDIHGTFGRLQTALDEHGFRPESGDRLISVGDLVDRGPESHLALEWLAKPWFHAVRGNHEDMAIRWPNGTRPLATYAANGGQWMIDNDDETAQRFADAFSELPVAIEIETSGGLVGVVHADCPFESWGEFVYALQDETISRSQRKVLLEAAMWSRERIQSQDTAGVTGVRAVVVGHTPMQRGVILGNVYFIDTAGWAKGYFTLLDAETLAPAYARRPSFA